MINGKKASSAVWSEATELNLDLHISGEAGLRAEPDATGAARLSQRENHRRFGAQRQN